MLENSENFARPLRGALRAGRCAERCAQAAARHSPSFIGDKRSFFQVGLKTVATQGITTPSPQQAMLAGCARPASRLRGSATAMAMAAIFRKSMRLARHLSVSAAAAARASMAARPRGQRRLHPSSARAATCRRARPSVVLVDAPAGESRAAHALAAETSAARRSAEDAIKKRELTFVPFDTCRTKNRICALAGHKVMVPPQV